VNKTSLEAVNISVDAGFIMVADMSYLDKWSKRSDPELERLGKTFEIPNGKYHVSWRIRDTWNGDVSDEEPLTVVSGKIFVCDPCYLIGETHDKWLDWLDKTSFGENLNDETAFMITKTGGDGCFDVELELEKVG
jgi:hypothetical protein